MCKFKKTDIFPWDWLRFTYLSILYCICLFCRASLFRLLLQIIPQFGGGLGLKGGLLNGGRWGLVPNLVGPCGLNLFGGGRAGDEFLVPNIPPRSEFDGWAGDEFPVPNIPPRSVFDPVNSGNREKTPSICAWEVSSSVCIYSHLKWV